MKVAIKQFQSLESVTIDLEGFTVLTGPSNLGKSAFIRALTAALFGLPGDHYIRYGAAQCGVGISDSGLKIKWYKTATGKSNSQRTSSLEINGTVHTKIGREHTTLTEPLGFKEIPTSVDRMRPQIALQHDHIFLLAENPTVVAEVLKMLGRADVVTEAQRRAKKDCKESEGKAKVRESDIKVAQGTVEELAAVPQQRQTWEKLRLESQEVERSWGVKQNLVKKIVRWMSLEPVILPGLVSVPRSPTNLKLLESIEKLRSLRAVCVPAVPLVRNPSSLALLELIEGLQIRRKEHNAISVEVQRVQEDLLRAFARKKELEQSLGVCPTCGRQFGNN